MNPYLAKLRVTSQENRHPQDPSKPSKPIARVVANGDTTAETGFEGFEGDRSRCLSIEQTPSGRFCLTIEHHASHCPDHVQADRWEAAVEDGRRFLTQWGEQAETLGWTARDLFGLASVPDQPRPNYRRLSGYDETGLIWLLRGRPVLALTARTAEIEGQTGTVTIYRRHKTGAWPAR
jgi:hypothetical protein